MPAFEQVYTPAEIERVSEYILALATGPAPAADPVVAGADIYDAQCAGCHGADAAGGLGPSLLTSGLSSEELGSIITSGGPTMPAFETLHSDEVEWLVAYIEAAADAAGGTSETEAPGATESSDSTPTSTDGTDATGTHPPPLLAGQLVFAENCGLCHGAEGAGGSAPSLRGINLTGNEIITRVYGGHSAGMPAFRQTLTSAEVQEVALYVVTLPEPSSKGLSRRTIGIGALTALVLAGGAYAAWR
jgi:mono/diheme cytochrome c family protein